MKRIITRIIYSLPFLWMSGAARPERYEDGLLKLASAVAAKEMCSCLFVMERDEDFCRSWTRVSPDIARFKINTDEKTVRGRALFSHSQARFVSEREGCVLEE